MSNFTLPPERGEGEGEEDEGDLSALYARPTTLSLDAGDRLVISTLDQILYESLKSIGIRKP